MQEKRIVLIAVLLIIIVAIVYTWATWQYFTIPVPGGNDFLAHYSVWDLYIKEGVNPYSDEAALYTQNLIRGRPAEIGEDQNRLTYPFYSILVHAPFTFIEYPLARAIYMTLLQGAVVLSVILTIRLLNWRLPIWLVAMLMSWSILHYPESRGIILGQFAPIGFLSIVSALYLLQVKRDTWAGIVLVISTMKPTLIFLVIPFLILWAVVQQRRQFLLGFLGMLGILMIGSFVLLPTWLSDWFLRIFAYSEYTVGQSPIWLLSHEYLPWLGNIGEVLFSVVLVFGLLFSWWHFFRRRDQSRFYWVIGITLLVSNLIVPRSATTNYVMLLLPILGLFAALDRRIRAGRGLVLIIMAVSLIGHWYLHYVTVIGNQEQPILFLPIPIGLAIGLFLGRSILLEDQAKAVITV
jgi:hypothetical protein